MGAVALRVAVSVWLLGLVGTLATPSARAASPPIDLRHVACAVGARAAVDLHTDRRGVGNADLFDRALESTTSERSDDGREAARTDADDTSPTDRPAGRPMPWSIVAVILAGMIAMTVVMQRLAFWWKGAAVVVGIGAVIVPVTLGGLPFWVAFYVPWILGMLLGTATGVLAREERLTALLLVVSAAITSVLALFQYKAMTHWQPPWETMDVLVVSFIEAFALTLAIWLVAAALLLALALVVVVPVNLVGIVFGRRSGDGGALRHDVNAWFRDRFAIVFGALGVIGEVGAAGDRRRHRRRRTASGSYAPEDERYRGGGGTFGGGGSSDDY